MKPSSQGTTTAVITGFPPSMPAGMKKSILGDGRSQEPASCSLSPWVPGPAMSRHLRVRSHCPVPNWVISTWLNSYGVAVDVGSSSFSTLNVQFTNIHVFTPSLWVDKQGTRSHSLSPVSLPLEVFLSHWLCHSTRAKAGENLEGTAGRSLFPLTSIQHLWDTGLVQTICQIMLLGEWASYQ